MDDQRTDRTTGGSVIKYRFKDAGRDVLRAIVIVACAMTVIGLIGTYFEQPSPKMHHLRPLSDRLTFALYFGPLVGSVLGAMAGIILASYRFIKSLLPTT
jgi:hypothetical protein